MRTSATFLLTVLAVVHLAGCVSNPTRPTSELDQAARAMLAQGQYALAADEFLRLADSTRDEQSQLFLLNAAGAQIADNQLDAARILLEGRAGGTLPASLGHQRAALLAEIGLAQQRPGDVLKLLPRELVVNASPNVQRGMMELRAVAYDQLGNHLEAAREAVSLDFYGLPPKPSRENRRFIWEQLQQLNGSALEAARVPPPDTFGGWVELAAIALAFGAEYASYEEGVAAWASRFPNHPASVTLVAELLEDSRARSKPPTNVALLLPMTGSFAEAARAVRDGFLSEWFADGADPGRPTISLHDTFETDVAALYQSTVAAGAEFVVGPLLKSSVAALAGQLGLTEPTELTESVELPAETADELADGLGAPADPEAVPTLALNLAPAGEGLTANDFLYQFALSPEEEAEQVAERAWFDGHGRVAILAPQTAWGVRVADAFGVAWEQLGGRVVENQAYRTEDDEEGQPPDLSVPVELLLNLDESEQRVQTLRKVLRRRVHFEPRPRDDIDFVFMAGFPREARQLRPQFRFHNAAGVPIYSTSHVFTGSPDAAADGDIDGITFGDMPWVLEPFGPSALARERAQRLWPNRARSYPRLYGFGADAYRLIMALRRLRASPGVVYEGHTGKLWLDEQRRVRRRLQWARFEEGVPRLVESGSGAP